MNFGIVVGSETTNLRVSFDHESQFPPPTPFVNLDVDKTFQNAE
jgi:hypothetical protein